MIVYHMSWIAVPTPNSRTYTYGRDWIELEVPLTPKKLRDYELELKEKHGVYQLCTISIFRFEQEVFKLEKVEPNRFEKLGGPLL